MWAFGIGYFFERYTYQNGEVDATNESGVKAFTNVTPWSWLTGRFSVQYAQRRYDHWLPRTQTIPPPTPCANSLCKIAIRPRRTELSNAA